MPAWDSNFPVWEHTGGGGGQHEAAVWRNQSQLLKPLLEGQHLGYLEESKKQNKKAVKGKKKSCNIDNNDITLQGWNVASSHQCVLLFTLSLSGCSTACLQGICLSLPLKFPSKLNKKKYQRICSQWLSFASGYNILCSYRSAWGQCYWMTDSWHDEREQKGLFIQRALCSIDYGLELNRLNSIKSFILSKQRLICHFHYFGLTLISLSKLLYVNRRW